MSRISRLAVAAVFCVALMIPAISAAHPGQRGFGQTFPIASRLCQRVDNGHAPGRLNDSVPQVVAACGTLKTSFTAAQNAYFTTVGPIKTAATTAIQTLRQTCRQARQNHTHAVCRDARKATRATLKGLRQQVAAAATTYHTSVEAARKAFWTTIHGLKGGSAIAADPTTAAAPAVALPSDSQVDSTG
jgi:uncharacterized protein (DUF3084 family)